MQIILLKKIESLGNLGDILRVKSGYARNFLIPYGKAMIANKHNIKLAEIKKLEAEKKLLKQRSLAEIKFNRIKSIKRITIFAKSGMEGKLFGSVGSKDIAKKLFELTQIKIHKKEISCNNGVLRHTGIHQVVFKPHNDFSATIEVNIESMTK